MRVLHLITARKGSKGLPGKNIKLLGDKPLFMYSVDYALRNMSIDDELCISTNDEQLISIAKSNNVNIHFKRPEILSTDSASSQDVINHALNYFNSIGKTFDLILLLQPTSPFRSDEDYKKIFEIFDSSLDMVVSVKVSKENPYFTLFEEDNEGCLHRSKVGNFLRRQDCPEVYTLNGSMYLIKIESINKLKIAEFKKIRKIVMPEERSIDIDTLADWTLAEFYLKNENS